MYSTPAVTVQSQICGASAVVMEFRDLVSVSRPVFSSLGLECLRPRLGLEAFRSRSRALNSGVARGGEAGGRGPRAELQGGRHFADQKLIFERSLKVLVFRYYFKNNFQCSTDFQFSYLEALDW